MLLEKCNSIAEQFNFEYRFAVFSDGVIGSEVKENSVLVIGTKEQINNGKYECELCSSENIDLVLQVIYSYLCIEFMGKSGEEVL